MWNAVLDDSQAGIKIVRRDINNLRYTDDTTLMAESKEELKSLLMRVKEESEKSGLKFSIQKPKIMASGLITSWQIDEETMGTLADFIFLGSKITVAGDCRHELKRHLLFGRKATTNLDSVLNPWLIHVNVWQKPLQYCKVISLQLIKINEKKLKSRDIIFTTKVCIVKATVCPKAVYGCESWTIKKTEHQRADAFESWCWKRLLRVPWTARRSNQSILKEINPEYSLEGLRLKLKLQYFGNLMWKADSLEKTLMLGNIEGRRRRGW